MTTNRRFKAPAGNGEILAVPGFAELPALIEENRRGLDRTDAVIDGLTLRELRAVARREVMALASRYVRFQQPGPPDGGDTGNGPLLLSGHQPELSHPGVWVKNFALNGLARKVGGVPLHLVVDNDVLKTTSLRFPVFRAGDPNSVHVETVPYDRFEKDEPYETRRIRDSAVFREFLPRASSLWRNWGYRPLLPDVWQYVDPGSHWPLGEQFAQLRRRLEAEWGCRNHEVTVSELVETEAFARFLLHVLSDLPRFHEIHNRALRDYRAANGVRSRNHPATDLVEVDGWWEAPFWCVAHDGVGRGRFFVKRAGARFVCRTKNEPPRAWSFSLDDLDNRFPDAPIRPRAVTLTLFARVCLGDFFIHGIGGGKYDEVTDQIIRSYLDVEPPAYQVLSATLHLPLPTFPSTDADVLRTERCLRGLYWNPQRYLPPEQLTDPVIRQLLARKQALAAVEPPGSDHAARKDWFRSLQQVTEQLRPFVAGQVPVAEEVRRRARTEVAANAILMRRDYSWVLYPEETLRTFMQRFLECPS